MTEDTENNLVVRGTDGDPVADPVSIRMTERESYERIREGLQIAADAAAHLTQLEPENTAQWTWIMNTLDQVRRAAIKKAGIEDPIKARQTEKVRRNPMPWREARDRFRDGMKQASGGARQLAICFRGDLSLVRLGHELERMYDSVTAKALKRTSSLILPPGYH